MKQDEKDVEHRIITKPPAAKGGRLGCHSSNGTPTSNNNLLSCISFHHHLCTSSLQFGQEGGTEWEFQEELRDLVDQTKGQHRNTNVI
uniref:Uncharacterized protein n=1 Tax=Oryza punctata TaxID=4537 RepID=A0A0E0ME36_ORYPU